MIDDARRSADEALRPADDARQPADDARRSADDARRSADDARRSADDALRPADDASYEAQLHRQPMNADEAELAARMIGRPLRGRSAVAVRCAWGLPAVLRVAPRLDDGTPFPTVFWLSCPLANRAVGRLEASGVMRTLTAQLDEDETLAAAYRSAHEHYVAMRDQLGPPVPGAPSAGGMPGRVKCLHALYAHHLATGDNPIGAWAARQIEPLACPGPCVQDDVDVA
jgi:hypothetical protein